MCSTGAKKGYFKDGTWEYHRLLHAPEQWRGKRVDLEFEGVQNRPMVYVNGQYAGQWAYGYTAFRVPIDQLLDYGADNVIKVAATTAQDSRWYTGAGIYRDVNLIVHPDQHIQWQSVEILTESLDDSEAVIGLTMTVSNDIAHRARVDVRVHIDDPDGVAVADCVIPVTMAGHAHERLFQRISVANPKPWSADEPWLYTCRIMVVDGQETMDEDYTRFGIRTIGLDSTKGLLVNGRETLLRGACVHHDHGVIGARGYAAAERRRVRKLKEAGFNAIRSSHQPASRQLLEACDAEGMYVLDEAFDVWLTSKSDDDYARDFPQWWRRDLDAMVRKDINHPSVVMYSIGNEIPDLAFASGCRQARMMTARIKELDPSRPTTLAINGSMLLMSAFGNGMPQVGKRESSGDVNAFMANLGEKMDQMAQAPMTEDVLAEPRLTVDIAGYNYLVARYEQEAVEHPERVILGTETYPKDIATIWSLTTRYPNIIGDFSWTGWDYIGEVGIGKFITEQEKAQPNWFSSSYPWMAAVCGDLDLTGERKPMSYWRQIVFGLRREPYIVVENPYAEGQRPMPTLWAWEDVSSHWDFSGREGEGMRVIVYSASEQVELSLDGVSLGRRPVVDNRAEFDVVYHPGELRAIGFTGDNTDGEYSIRTPDDDTVLTVTGSVERVDGDDRRLVYVDVRLEDGTGVMRENRDRAVHLDVDGGELIGFGSADPKDTEPFAGASHRTWHGHAQAVVLVREVGTVRVEAHAEGLPVARCECKVE